MFEAFTGWDSHEWTTVEGTPIHAAAHGKPDGPTVVCVHGLGCSHRYFWPFARAMAPHVRVVAPDLPGFGRTPGGEVLDVRGQATALAGWLRGTGRTGSVLVANSTGCQVAVEVAATFGDVAGPLVLNSPTFDAGARRRRTQVWRLLRDGPRERPSLAVVLAVDYLTCGVRRGYRTFRLFLPDPIEDKATAVRLPVVVVVGGSDPIMGRSWGAQLAARFPNGCYVEVPGQPHALHYAAPEALARITTALLDRSTG